MKPRVGGFWHVAFCKRYALLPPLTMALFHLIPTTFFTGCAKSSFTFGEKIVGGEVTFPHSVPYQVMVHNWKAKKMCGGVILNKVLKQEVVGSKPAGIGSLSLSIFSRSR